MLLNLPRPYDDELLYSVFARYFTYAEPCYKSSSFSTVLGAKRFSIKFARQVNELAAQTGPAWGKSANRLLDEHTLIPFFASFLLPRDHNECLRLLKESDGAGAKKLGLNFSRVDEPDFLKFCDSCASEDFAGLGETYWRRSHQLGGVLLCSKHDEILRASSASTSSRQNGCQDASAYVTVGAAPDCVELTGSERDLAREIGRRCVEVLEGRQSKWTSPFLSEAYRRSAMQIGYSIGLKKLDGKKLESDFVSFFGLSLLFKLGLKRDPAATLRHVFASSKHVNHPLIHVLVQMFLESSTRTFRIRSGFFVPPARYVDSWKCPNPFFEHPDSFRLPMVSRRRSKERKNAGYFFARCSCGFSFSFRKTLSDDPSVPVVQKMVAYGRAFEEEAKRLSVRGLTNKAIAEVMKIDQGVVARLLRGQKNSYESSPHEVSYWRTRWKLERSQSAYRYLLRNDREWLNANKQRATMASRDWANYDRACVPALKNAAATIKELYPPVRVTRASLAATSKTPALLSKERRKMPRSHRLLLRLCEPNDAWTARRKRGG
jgi:Tn7-like transposition protein D/TniQ